MSHPTDELNYRIIKSSIKKIGDYENSIEINSIEVSGEKAYSYKINEDLVRNVIKNITDTIERDAEKRGLKVMQIK
ncbi:MAG: hypothetical protein M3139_04845 [Bacteroidota bacterium]|nr:hypothetical protein [Bacteroidota bacterium]